MGTRTAALSQRLDPERRLLLALVLRAATDWKRAEALGVRPGHMPSRLTRRIGAGANPPPRQPAAAGCRDAAKAAASSGHGGRAFLTMHLRRDDPDDTV